MSSPVDTFLAAIANAATSSEGQPSLESFMAMAVAMELATGQRYDQLADMVETRNNPDLEVVQLFRTLADIERKHADALLTQMGWTDAPPPSVAAWDAGASEGPEAAATEELHDLMLPYHALQIALRNEERAERFFGLLAAAASSAPVREAALAIEREEREHVALVKAWIAKVPQPGTDSAVDPDPSWYAD